MKLLLVLAGVLGPTLASTVSGDASWLAALAVPVAIGARRIWSHVQAELDPGLVVARAAAAAELRELGR